jgi:hypothetical protein
MSKIPIPGRIVAFVAETLNGDRGGTFLDENGVVWRGSLAKAACLVNGESQPTLAADAREGWAEVVDGKRLAQSVTSEQPHGIATQRIYGQVEIVPAGPLDRIDAKLGSKAVLAARDAVRALRMSADPMPALADRLEAALNAEA